MHSLPSRFAPRNGVQSDGERPELRPIPTRAWIAIVLVTVAMVTGVVTTAMLLIATHAARGTAEVRAELDAVRTGLASGAGAAALLGLMLTFRKQHHAEIETVWTALESARGHVLEKYGQATDQFGSDKAAVQLAGLFSMEQLAQDNPEYRQVIANLICAHLRSLECPPEVRQACQRVLANHLRPADEPGGMARFWADLRLDLAGVTLDAPNWDDCVFGETGFAGATFDGPASFENVIFKRPASFEKCIFTSSANFSVSTFAYGADLDAAVFGDNVTFESAEFGGPITGLDTAEFRGGVTFAHAIVKPAAGKLQRDWPAPWKLRKHAGGDGILVRPRS